MPERRPRGELKAQVAALLNGKRTAREIADTLQTSTEYVHATATRLGARDMLKASRRNDRHSVVIAMPREVLAWVRDKKPAGSTVSEFVTAILEDAMHEADDE